MQSDQWSKQTIDPTQPEPVQYLVSDVLVHKTRDGLASRILLDITGTVHNTMYMVQPIVG